MKLYVLGVGVLVSRKPGGPPRQAWARAADVATRPESPLRAFTLHPWLASDVETSSLHLFPRSPPALPGSSKEAASGSVPTKAVLDQDLVWGVLPALLLRNWCFSLEC